MKQIVIPRKTSRAKNLGEASVIVVGQFIMTTMCEYYFNFTSKNQYLLKIIKKYPKY
jgi:hypothetical protein